MSINFTDSTILLLTALCSLALYVVTRVLTLRFPSPYPVLGHLPYVAGRPRHVLLDFIRDSSLFRKGQTWKLSLPGIGEGWVINDPACLKHVLMVKYTSFNKAGVFARRTRELFGTGILTATGEHHRIQRQAGRTFASQETLSQIANDTLPRALRLITHALETAADDGKTIDFAKLAKSFTIALFGEIAFDADQEDLITNLEHPFDEALELISKRFTTPFYQLVEGVTDRGSRLRSSLGAVRAFGKRMVEKAVEQIKAEQLGLVDVQHGRSLLIRGLIDGGLTNIEEITDICLTFILAGRDTTADAAAWVLYDLISNPSYIARLTAEISSLPDEFDKTGLLYHLPLLSTVISESLRLHPPVPLEMLECTSKTPVPLPDGTIVRYGQQILWQPHTMALLNPSFGSDPEIFRPERWNGIKPTSYEFSVFYAGPRACLGQKLAKMELGWLVVELLGRFEFDKAWDGEKVFGEGLAGDMMGGLPVKVTRRRVEPTK